MIFRYIVLNSGTIDNCAHEAYGEWNFEYAHECDKFAKEDMKEYDKIYVLDEFDNILWLYIKGKKVERE